MSSWTENSTPAFQGNRSYPACAVLGNPTSQVELPSTKTGYRAVVIPEAPPRSAHYPQCSECGFFFPEEPEYLNLRP